LPIYRLAETQAFALEDVEAISQHTISARQNGGTRSSEACFHQRYDFARCASAGRNAVLWQAQSLVSAVTDSRAVGLARCRREGVLQLPAVNSCRRCQSSVHSAWPILSAAHTQIRANSAAQFAAGQSHLFVLT
jgi:hypothetical protein